MEVCQLGADTACRVTIQRLSEHEGDRLIRWFTATRISIRLACMEPDTGMMTRRSISRSDPQPVTVWTSIGE